jgi:hypothetical protein
LPTFEAGIGLASSTLVSHHAGGRDVFAARQRQVAGAVGNGLSGFGTVAGQFLYTTVGPPKEPSNGYE